MTEPRHPFEVVGETTVKVGGPPAPTDKEVRLDGDLVGTWDNAEENPLQAVLRLRREVLGLRGQRERAEAEFQLRLQTERELERFREQVRDKAIEVAERMDWCTPGLNEVLRDLGLPEKVTRWRVPVTVEATQTVWITVEADSADDAYDEVTSQDITDAVDEDAWSVGDWNKSEYDYVEPAGDDD